VRATRIALGCVGGLSPSEQGLVRIYAHRITERAPGANKERYMGSLEDEIGG
jgi:hypothetical protein